MKLILAIVLGCSLTIETSAQLPKGGKPISADLFGLFFEDINYAADGGLYAELVQNRSFEYSPTESKDWNPFSYWEYQSLGYSYGTISVETSTPIHQNNPHYIEIDVKHIGNEPTFRGIPGVALKNSGFDGMVIQSGDQYQFSLFARTKGGKAVTVSVQLLGKTGAVIGQNELTIQSQSWKKYNTTITATKSESKASLQVIVTAVGGISMDMISLFPQKTFKNRPNGLRADLATVLANMKPKFIRFPGGCLVHGDGLHNMYRWKNTIGPLEMRVEQRNLWNYHQSVGLGYFEFFQFCEDIGAKPLPVVPAAVSCQNSGGTYKTGGTGQKALPMAELQDYIQEILDLIEWANGPATSTWGALRAEAGHPEPFHLEYVGIGNEEKITPEFQERFTAIYKAVKAKYPKIKLVGTSGPFHSGEDYEKGWALANQLKVDVVDEHYYVEPKWFVSNQNRYDSYNRKGPKVYLGEYASWGNKLKNALAEALYLTSIERNGDVVSMASYAPMLAKKNFTQWTTDMIFFDNEQIVLTPNFYVQQLFMQNSGDYYHANVFKQAKDSLMGASCVQDSKTGDVILKMVNYNQAAKSFKVDLSRFGTLKTTGTRYLLTGNENVENTFDQPNQIAPVSSTFNVNKKFDYTAPPMSLTVIRIPRNK